MSELVTPQEIAQLLRLPPRAVAKIIKRPSFPPPVINESQKLRRWFKDSVETWMREQERRNG